MTTKPHKCGRCTTRWSGSLTCHCGACHETFSGIGHFDRHRNGGKCNPPASCGLQILPARPGIWGQPGEGE